MILRNCSGVWKRDEAVTVALSIWPGIDGVPPTSPAATSTFWALMALMTSLGISEKERSLAGSSQMRMA